MRDDARGKDQPRLLRRPVNRSEQTTASEFGAPCVRIHNDFAHPREVDYQTAIAGAEASKAMTAAPDRGENSVGRGDSGPRVAHR